MSTTVAIGSCYEQKWTDYGVLYIITMMVGLERDEIQAISPMDNPNPSYGLVVEIRNSSQRSASSAFCCKCG